MSTEPEAPECVDFRLWPIQSPLSFYWQGATYRKVSQNHAMKENAPPGTEPEFVPSHEKVFFSAPEAPEKTLTISPVELTQLEAINDFRQGVREPLTEERRPQSVFVAPGTIVDIPPTMSVLPGAETHNES